MLETQHNCDYVVPVEKKIYLSTYILSEKVEFVNSLRFLSCLSPKIRHYATKKGYENSDQCYICNIIGLFNKRFYAKNIQENFMFFNGLHKANTHLQHNRNYVVNTLKISYWQSKRFVIKNS